MIWGHDYSMQLLVNLAILIIILLIHFIRLYIKRKTHQNEDEKRETHQNEDEITKNQTKS